MRRLVTVGALALLAGCSSGEIIPTPTPASEPTTEPRRFNSAASAPDPTTTTTEPEPEPTTIPAAPAPTRPPRTVPPVPSPPTSQYLQPEATIASGPLAYGNWAIPEYIVSCETGGTFSWTAYNASSGASGPYQLIPLHFNGELAMNQSRQAQHDKAAQLWNGGKGKSHWSACL